LFPFLLILVGTLVILTMSVWHINHPDTIEYHSIIIESIKDKKLENGGALQNLRYGLQSNWFISCALFSLDFFSFYNLTYINSAILIWVICFTGFQIQKNSFSIAHQKYHHKSLLWIFFLVFAFWDYVQIRLTATSASPDFPTTIYILLIGYYFITYQQNKENILLLFFLIAFTFSLKLFSFPLIVLLIYLGYSQLKKYTSSILPSFIIFLITCSPFMLRNYYVSGHILYPSTFPMAGKPVWQVPITDLQYLHDYIKAYARTASSDDPTIAKQVANAALSDWLPDWWKLRNSAQKTILLLTVTFLMVSLVFIRKIFLHYSIKQKALFSTNLLGLISWFLLAPDPRFGTAYFVLLGYTALINTDKFYLNSMILEKSTVISLSLLSLGLFGYLTYRIIYYFDLVNLLNPYSI